MARGTIMKALSGFYYVLGSEGIERCKPRGVFRKNGITPLVGDEVIYTAEGSGDGTITELLPRKNALRRPPVANIDQLVIIIAAVTPVAEPYLIDKMVSFAAANGIEPVICLNKADLGRDPKLMEIYHEAGYRVAVLSAETGEGLEEIRELLKGKVSAFAGNSGVGKSSIINRLLPELQLPTGEVSEKLGRGRHTTRHVELFELPQGGRIADTPGFSFFDPESLELPEPERLWESFREFGPYAGACRYPDCSHTREKGCGVLEAVKAGKISAQRHRSYCRLYEEAKKMPAWQRRQLAEGK